MIFALVSGFSPAHAADVPKVQAGASPARLFLPTNGVALSQFPSYNRLSRSVPVDLTRNHDAVSWTATSSQPWLSVTQSGMTGQLITLTATPGTLTQNTAHIAIVTVSTSELGPAPVTANIRVSLWLGSSDPQTLAITQPTESLAANPIEPWVYVNPGNTSIVVLNVYTGALVTTFSEVAPTIGEIVVSPDGYQLFAVDTTNYKIIELNAVTGKQVASFALDGPVDSFFSFAYARPITGATLFAVGEPAIRVANGERISKPLTSTHKFLTPLLQATPDGSRLAVLERGEAPGSLYTFSVSGAAGQLTITPQKTATLNGGGSAALTFSSDGSRLYPASGEVYEFDVYDWSTLKQVQTLPAGDFPGNAMFDSLGDFIGSSDGIYQTDDIFIFDTAGYSLGSVPTTTYDYSNGLASNSMAISGDSTRVISVIGVSGSGYNGNILLFRNLPP